MNKSELHLRWEAFKINARFFLPNKIQEIKYNRKVNHEEHDYTAEQARLFSGEFADFLRENPTEILSSLHPDEEQMKNIYFFLAHIRDKTLRQVYESKDFSHENPRLYLNFEGVDEGELDTFNDLRLRGLDNTNMSMFWDVTNQYPINLHIEGTRHKLRDNSLDLINKGLGFHFFYNVLTEQEDLPDYMNRIHPTGERRWTDIYQDGKRLVQHSEWTSKGEKHSWIEEYQLLGSFDGLGTGKTYVVYGHNREKDIRRSTKQPKSTLIFSPVS